MFSNFQSVHFEIEATLTSNTHMQAALKRL